MIDTTGKPPGTGADILSDRDKWIKDEFGYIQQYMKRVAEGKRKKGGQLAQHMSTTTTTAPTPSTSHQHPSA